MRPLLPTRWPANLSYISSLASTHIRFYVTSVQVDIHATFRSLNARYNDRTAGKRYIHHKHFRFHPPKFSRKATYGLQQLILKAYLVLRYIISSKHPRYLPLAWYMGQRSCREKGIRISWMLQGLSTYFFNWGNPRILATKPQRTHVYFYVALFQVNLHATFRSPNAWNRIAGKKHMEHKSFRFD